MLSVSWLNYLFSTVALLSAFHVAVVCAPPWLRCSSPLLFVCVLAWFYCRRSSIAVVSVFHRGYVVCILAELSVSLWFFSLYSSWLYYLCFATLCFTIAVSVSPANIFSVFQCSYSVLQLLYDLFYWDYIVFTITILLCSTGLHWLRSTMGV